MSEEVDLKIHGLTVTVTMSTDKWPVDRIDQTDPSDWYIESVCIEDGSDVWPKITAGDPEYAVELLEEATDALFGEFDSNRAAEAADRAWRNRP